MVQVTLNDGSTGVAEAPPRPTIYGETVYSITSIIEHELAPRVLGVPLEKVQARLQEVKNNHTAKGALDMALHDALAQHKGISLAEQLGASLQPLKVSYILGIGDRDTVLAEAQRDLTPEQAAEAEARHQRALLLRSFEQSPLSKANFGALKGLSEEALDALLTLARQERGSR